MAFKKWIVHTADKGIAKQLAEECDIDPFTAMIANVRGYVNADELEQLLTDEPLLSDPNELADIRTAANILNTAIENGTKIAVFGDYDCDGVCATALLMLYLKSRNADAASYIPDRHAEGYGMNREAVDRLAKQGVQLILTVDNGISCADEIEYAKTKGIETVVTDHHLPPEQLPDAVAVVDPHRADCPSGFKEICGTAVAFKLICVADDKEPEQLLGEYADLLAIATVGDVMPLVNENRSFVRAGIRKIKQHPRIGTAALLSVAGLEREQVNAIGISFGMVPRINAAGRMGSAERAYGLLTCDNMMEALGLANELDAENATRQRIERDILNAACAEIEQNGYQYQRVIVVAGENWHPGVVGIVASRIVERYGKPAIVLNQKDGSAQGSGRSIPGFSLYNAVHACGDILIKYGGHELAAGISLKSADIAAFRQKINEYARTLPQSVPELDIDLRLNPSALSLDMIAAISVLEPFGNGNPSPIFGIFGVTLSKITPIGSGKHLKLLFTKDGAAFQALLFGVTPEQFCFEIGDILDLAVHLEENIFQGNRTLSVQIKALRMNGTDDGLVFSQLFAYHDFLCGDVADETLLTPSRAQIGQIYRQILKQPVKSDRLKYLFLNEPGYAKTQIALTVLNELNLIERTEDGYRAIANAPKNDLSNSPTYRELHGEGTL